MLSDILEGPTVMPVIEVFRGMVAYRVDRGEGDHRLMSRRSEDPLGFGYPTGLEELVDL